MKTPPAVHGVTIPGWATPHNIGLMFIAASVLLVIFGLMATAHRLAKAVAAAAAPPPPPPAPKKPGGGVFLLIAAAIGGWWLLKGHAMAAAPVKAAPSPSPSPSPTPTVTVTAPPPASAPQPGPLDHLAAFLGHLSGTEWTVIFVCALLVAYAIVRPLLKRGD